MLDALEQAIHSRRPDPNDGLIHYCDKVVQYLIVNYCQRLDDRNATLRWVDWFNHHRLFAPFGQTPPAEAEANYSAANELLDMVAWTN